MKSEHIEINPKIKKCIFEDNFYLYPVSRHINSVLYKKVKLRVHFLIKVSFLPYSVCKRNKFYCVEKFDSLPVPTGSDGFPFPTLLHK